MGCWRLEKTEVAPNKDCKARWGESMVASEPNPKLLVSSVVGELPFQGVTDVGTYASGEDVVLKGIPSKAERGDSSATCTSSPEGVFSPSSRLSSSSNSFVSISK